MCRELLHLFDERQDIRQAAADLMYAILLSVKSKLDSLWVSAGQELSEQIDECVTQLLCCDSRYPGVWHFQMSVKQRSELMQLPCAMAIAWCNGQCPAVSRTALHIEAIVSQFHEEERHTDKRMRTSYAMLNNRAIRVAAARSCGCGAMLKSAIFDFDSWLQERVLHDEMQHTTLCIARRDAGKLGGRAVLMALCDTSNAGGAHPCHLDLGLACKLLSKEHAREAGCTPGVWVQLSFLPGKSSKAKAPRLQFCAGIVRPSKAAVSGVHDAAIAWVANRSMHMDVPATDARINAVKKPLELTSGDLWQHLGGARGKMPSLGYQQDAASVICVAMVQYGVAIGKQQQRKVTVQTTSG